MNEGTEVFKGFVYKKSAGDGRKTAKLGLHNWERRFFVLVQHEDDTAVILYYEQPPKSLTEDTALVKGVIMVHRIVSVDFVDGSKRDHRGRYRFSMSEDHGVERLYSTKVRELKPKWRRSGEWGLVVMDCAPSRHADLGGP